MRIESFGLTFHGKERNPRPDSKSSARPVRTSCASVNVISCGVILSYDFHRKPTCFFQSHTLRGKMSWIQGRDVNKTALSERPNYSRYAADGANIANYCAVLLFVSKTWIKSCA